VKSGKAEKRKRGKAENWEIGKLRNAERVPAPAILIGLSGWATATNRLTLSPGEELLRVQPKPLDPTKLIVEFGGAQWIAVRRVERRNNDAAHVCFNIAAMAIRRIRGQPARAPGGCDASTAQDRHAVKALLPFSAWCTACVAMRRARRSAKASIIYYRYIDSFKALTSVFNSLE